MFDATGEVLRMIVKTYDSLAGTKGETVLGGGRAVTRRFLLKEDGG